MKEGTRPSDDPQAALIDALSPERVLEILGPGASHGIGAPSDWEPLTELRLAEAFVVRHGQTLRHVRTWRSWLVYDGRRWLRDETGAVDRLLKDFLREQLKEAADLTEESRRAAVIKRLLQFSTAQHLRSVLELASTEPEVATTTDTFDQDPYTLNLLNGSLDLRTGKLRAHQRRDLITKLAPVMYEPNATCPRWENFLQEIFDNDSEMIAFLQRAVGYTLTGDTGEQVLFFCHGNGANGKTVFLELLHAVLGPDYAVNTPFATFLARYGDTPRNDLARLRGARLVSASEAPGGRALDEALLKEIVGGDTITSRFLYQEFFEFRPQFKLWLRANHLPPVREQTHAFWRRMRLLPFTVTIPDAKRDTGLLERLVTEAPGILAWALYGALSWQRNGLGEPPAVLQATESYRAENDTLGDFLDARCTLDPAVWTSTADLYRAFVGWWEATHTRNEKPLGRSWFGRALSELPGLRKRDGSHKIRGWAGVRLTDPMTLVEPPRSESITLEDEDDLPF